MNNYISLITKQRNEFNEFPMMFAFSNDQFKEGMMQLGLDEGDTDKIYSIPGGGFIKKTDSKAFNSLLDRHEKELNDAIESDLTGLEFIYDMFVFELNNHEYSYTRDSEPALLGLGLTFSKVIDNPKLLLGFTKACKDCL